MKGKDLLKKVTEAQGSTDADKMLKEILKHVSRKANFQGSIDACKENIAKVDERLAELKEMTVEEYTESLKNK